jgi:hypothetical protein
MDLNAAYGKTNVDLAAPGAVYTLRPSNTYNSFGGTSGAAPHVAGAIALLAAYPNAEWAESLKNTPQLSALFLKEIILKTVDKFSSFSGKSTSEGRLSVGSAMNMLKTYYSNSNNPITVQQWDEEQTLIKFEIETAGEYSLEIFDLMGRLREKRNYNFEIPGRYRDFIDATSRKNEILIARLSLKNGKRIGVVKF